MMLPMLVPALHCKLWDMLADDSRWWTLKTAALKVQPAYLSGRPPAQCAA